MGDHVRTLRRFALLRRIARVVMPGYRLTSPFASWWTNRDFNEYLDRFAVDEGLGSARRFALSQLLRLVEGLEGDTAECGVYRGASSYLICRANGSQRTHHVFDSFEGLSTRSELDAPRSKAGDLAYSLDVVRRNLSEFDRIVFHEGWIPSRFPDVADRTFAFVHLDVELYEPTRDSIAFFYPRTAAGGIILCDDYGFDSCPGATRAVDEFLANRPEAMVGLSAGGGCLIKGCRTAPAWGAASG